MPARARAGRNPDGPSPPPQGGTLSAACLGWFLLLAGFTLAQLPPASLPKPLGGSRSSALAAGLLGSTPELATQESIEAPPADSASAAAWHRQAPPHRTPPVLVISTLFPCLHGEGCCLTVAPKTGPPTASESFS